MDNMLLFNDYEDIEQALAQLADIDGKGGNLNQTKKEAHESIIKLKEQIHAKLAPAKDKAMQLQEKRRQIKA